MKYVLSPCCSPPPRTSSHGLREDPRLQRHSHALNRPCEDQPSPVCLHRSDRLSQRLHPPTRLGRQHGVHEPTHRTRAACTGCSTPADEDVVTGVTTLSHLLRDALHLPEGHPRQQRVHRQSDARCDLCVVGGKATTHMLSAT